MLVTVGDPVVVTLNVFAPPTTKVAAFALVMAGGAFTASVKLCVAFGVTPLFAVIVIGKVPPAVGVPASVAVPLLLLVNVTPAGSAPSSVIDIDALVGTPVVVTVKVPAWLIVKVVLFALVIVGAWFTVSVKLCVALGAMPLLAVIVIGYSGTRHCSRW